MSFKKYFVGVFLMVLFTQVKAQHVFYLEARDAYNGEPVKVDFRVESVLTGKSYTIKNEDGTYFVEIPKPDEIRVKAIKDEYYPEEKTYEPADFDEIDPTIKFSMQKRPMANLKLIAIDKESKKQIPASFQVFFEGRMVGRGNTSLSSLEYSTLMSQDGDYFIDVEAAGYEARRVKIPLKVGSPINVFTNEVHLDKPAKQVAIKLLDEQSGKPVKATIEVYDSKMAKPVFAQTPDNGMALFTFNNGINYRIKISSREYQDFEKFLEGSQKEDLIIRVRPKTYVTFSVKNSATKKEIEAEILVTDPSGKEIKVAENTFVPPVIGTYSVKTSAPGYNTKTGTIQINNFGGGKNEFNLELDEADKQYSISFIDHYSKEILHGVNFRVFASKGSELKGLKENENAEWQFITDPEKQYFVEASLEGYSDFTKQLTQENKKAVYELWWKPEYTITYQLLDATTKLKVANVDELRIVNTRNEKLFVFKSSETGEYKAKLNKNEAYSYFVESKDYKTEVSQIKNVSNNLFELLLASKGQKKVSIEAQDLLTKRPVKSTFSLAVNGNPISKAESEKMDVEFSPNVNYSLKVQSKGYADYNGVIKSTDFTGDQFIISLKKDSYLTKIVIENLKDKTELRSLQLRVLTDNGTRKPEKFSATNAWYELELQAEDHYQLEIVKDGYETFSGSFNLKELIATDFVKTVNLDKKVIPVLASVEPEAPKEEVKVEEPKPKESEKKERAKPEPRKADKPAEKLEKEAYKLPTGNAISTELVKKESVGKRYLLEEVFFDQSSYEIRDEEIKQLDEIANTLKNNEKLVVEIVGYTDDQGDPRRNLGLSKFRAKAVANYLFNKGADPSKIKSTGYGQQKPIAQNDTEEGRSKNRRVELVVLEN